MNIGEEIKKARKQKKMTQKKLAELSGIAEITIRQYEAGNYSPKMEQLQKLSLALQIPVSDLVSGNHPNWHMFDAANRGLIAMLETTYDTVDVWHSVTDNDGVMEYSGEFTVTLSKKGSEDIILDAKAWKILFDFMRKNITAYVNLIWQYESESYHEPDNYHGE